MNSKALVAGVSALGLIAGVAIAQSFGAPQPAYPVSFEGITPTQVAGNDPNQSHGKTEADVCRELVGSGIDGIPDDQLRWFRRNVPEDVPPDGDDNVKVARDATNTYLAWAAANASTTVLAIAMKGGNNYHLYSYVTQPETSDSWLASPLAGGSNIAGISHYSICYRFNPAAFEGCTPGYWRNHTDRWEGYATTDMFNTVFGVAGPNATLQQVVSAPQTYGAFAMHAVAALLNSVGGIPNENGDKVDYQYTTAEVIAIVQGAYAVGTRKAFNDALALLSAANEAGCPLSGTPAFRG